MLNRGNRWVSLSWLNLFVDACAVDRSHCLSLKRKNWIYGNFRQAQLRCFSVPPRYTLNDGLTNVSSAKEGKQRTVRNDKQEKPDSFRYNTGKEQMSTVHKSISLKVSKSDTSKPRQKHNPWKSSKLEQSRLLKSHRGVRNSGAEIENILSRILENDKFGSPDLQQFMNLLRESESVEKLCKIVPQLLPSKAGLLFLEKVMKRLEDKKMFTALKELIAAYLQPIESDPYFTKLAAVSQEHRGLFEYLISISNPNIQVQVEYRMRSLLPLLFSVHQGHELAWIILRTRNCGTEKMFNSLRGNLNELVDMKFFNSTVVFLRDKLTSDKLLLFTSALLSNDHKLQKRGAGRSNVLWRTRQGLSAVKDLISNNDMAAVVISNKVSTVVPFLENVCQDRVIGAEVCSMLIAKMKGENSQFYDSVNKEIMHIISSPERAKDLLIQDKGTSLYETLLKYGNNEVVQVATAVLLSNVELLFKKDSQYCINTMARYMSCPQQAYNLITHILDNLSFEELKGIHTQTFGILCDENNESVSPGVESALSERLDYIIGNFVAFSKDPGTSFVVQRALKFDLNQDQKNRIVSTVMENVLELTSISQSSYIVEDVILNNTITPTKQAIQIVEVLCQEEVFRRCFVDAHASDLYIKILTSELPITITQLTKLVGYVFKDVELFLNVPDKSEANGDLEDEDQLDTFRGGSRYDPNTAIKPVRRKVVKKQSLRYLSLVLLNFRILRFTDKSKLLDGIVRDKMAKKLLHMSGNVPLLALSAIVKPGKREVTKSTEEVVQFFGNIVKISTEIILETLKLDPTSPLIERTELYCKELLMNLPEEILNTIIDFVIDQKNTNEEIAERILAALNEMDSSSQELVSDRKLFNSVERNE